jgi:hypothetical protein
MRSGPIETTFAALLRLRNVKRHLATRILPASVKRLLDGTGDAVSRVSFSHCETSVTHSVPMSGAA